MKSHLLSINYDATIENDWSKVREFIEHHTTAEFAGVGHYQNRGDLDFWCDENTGCQVIQLLSLYFHLSAYDEVKPTYISPFTRKIT